MDVSEAFQRKASGDWLNFPINNDVIWWSRRHKVWLHFHHSFAKLIWRNFLSATLIRKICRVIIEKSFFWAFFISNPGEQRGEIKCWNFFTDRQSDLLFSPEFLFHAFIFFNVSSTSFTVHAIVYFQWCLLYNFFYLVLPFYPLIAIIKSDPISSTKMTNAGRFFFLWSLIHYSLHIQQAATMIRKTTAKDMNCLYQLKVTLEMKNENSFVACCFVGVECNRQACAWVGSTDER